MTSHCEPYGPLNANSKVYAQGQATPGVRFTVARNNVQIYQSPTDTTTAFAFTASSSVQPFYFPGSFQVCARNLGTTTASVLAPRLMVKEPAMGKRSILATSVGDLAEVILKSGDF